MAKKPTAEDAHLILELYDLRREAKLRQARDWYFRNYFADTLEEGMRIAAPGTEKRRRHHESRHGHGNGREQLDETGDQLLGNGGVVRGKWRTERKAFFRHVVLRRIVFHFRQSAAVFEGTEREDQESGVNAQR